MSAIQPQRPIGELCELINGRAFKPEDWGTKGLPIVRIQNLNDPARPFNYYDGAYSDKHLVDTGDVLLSWSGTPGTSFGCFIWARGKALLNQHIFKVQVNREVVSPDYFVFATNSRLGEMIQLAHGAAGLRHITKGKLEQIKLPIPPFEEQHRIVANIRECFERTEEIASLRAAARQESESLLSSLIESEIGQNAAKAHAWNTRKIGEIVTRVRNGRSISQDTQGNANGAVLTITAVRDMSLGMEFKKPVQFSDHIASQFAIEEGDVFVSRANTLDLVGLAAVAMSTPSERLIYPDLLIKLKVDKESIRPRFLAYALRCASGRRQIKARALGANRSMVKISGERLRQISVAVPTLAEQDQILDRLDAAHCLSDQLISVLRDDEIESLRKAILQRFFAGEL